MGQKQLFNLATLTSQPAISMARIRKFLVPVPPLNEQHEIVENLISQDKLSDSEQKYSDKLKLQKKGLMHDLLTSKVKVKV